MINKAEYAPKRPNEEHNRFTIKENSQYQIPQELSAVKFCYDGAQVIWIKEEADVGQEVTVQYS